MRNLWKRKLSSIAPLLVGAWSSGAPTTVAHYASPSSVAISAGAPGGARRLGLRLLMCRGGPGLNLEVFKDPSPDDPRYLRVALRYRRQSTPAGSDYKTLESGACTWNNMGEPNVPVEPGVVYFDIAREAQPWSSKETRKMDTTIDAAAFFPDLISLTRYLADARKYWNFFVDDKTQFSNSFGAYKPGVLQPTLVTVTGSLTRDPSKPAAVSTLSLTRELRCRGGPEGLSFTRGASAGTNLMKMTLAYRVASVEFGATGKGVGPGMCAWVERGAGASEPGRVEFTTSANAQLSQIRSGSAVDRTPTAAERFPDANTIPAYMTDPNHYWSFTVARTAPTIASANAAWKATIMDIVTGKPPSQSPKSVSKPDAPEAQPLNAPGARSPTSDAIRTALGIRDVVVRPGLDAVAILFSTASSAKPAVMVATAPFPGGPGTYQQIPGRQQLVVKGTLHGNVWQYTAYSQTALPMNTRHWYFISTEATAGIPGDQRTGEFMTKNQSVLVSFYRVHILNDSDKDSDGELSFRFYLAPATESEPCFGRPDVDDCFDRGFNGRQWGSGSTHSLANTLRMSTAPDRIRVWVKGWDNDDLDDDYWGHSIIGPGGTARFGWKGGSDRTADWNTASGEFNIGVSRDKDRISIPFKLRSVDGSVFMFEVEGEIQVTRR